MVHEGVKVTGVISQDARFLWPEVAPLLERALDPAEYDLNNLLALIEAKEFQLWVAVRGPSIIAAMTSTIQVYPAGKICVLVHMGGKWDAAMKAALPKICEWARDHNVSGVRLIGRPGWEKLLAPYARVAGSIMEIAA